jgi:hypothetical protein
MKIKPKKRKRHVSYFIWYIIFLEKKL